MPPARLTNDDISTLIDTSDEWITTRTGIRERRVSHVSVSLLAQVAAQRALAAAGRSEKARAVRDRAYRACGLR